MTEAVTGFQKSVSTIATQTCGGSEDSHLQGFRCAALRLGGNSGHSPEVIGTALLPGASLPG